MTTENEEITTDINIAISWEALGLQVQWTRFNENWHPTLGGVERVYELACKMRKEGRLQDPEKPVQFRIKPNDGRE